MENTKNPFANFGTMKPDANPAPTDEALDWDAPISEESTTEYFLLQPGVYEFTVKNFDRKQYQPRPGSKLPACNQAVLHLLVKTPQGRQTEVTTNLYLVKSQEWKLSAFFRCIGLKKPGEKLVMDWQRVPGSTGMVEISNREYNNRMYNDVARFVW